MSPGRWTGRRLVAGVTILAGAFWAYHLALAAWLVTQKQPVGALHPHKAVPLYSNFNRHFDLWFLPALFVVGVFFAVMARRYLIRLPAPGLLAASVAWFWLICLSVSMIDGYRPTKDDTPKRVPAFLQPFSHKGHEYHWDVRIVNRIGGPKRFLEHYATDRVQGRCSLHGGTHPPGAALFLWLVSRAFGHTLWTTSLAAIAVTAPMLILTYLIGAELFGTAVAQISTALVMVMPSLVLFTATSMDGPFSVLILTSIWLFVRATAPGRPHTVVFGLLLGLALTAGTFMTYATLCLAFFFLAMLFYGWRTGSLEVRRAVIILSIAATTFASLVGLLVWTTGYEPIAALRAARSHDAEMMGTGYETLARYVNISVANLAAFLIGAGLPATLLWGAHLPRILAARFANPRGAAFAAAGAVTILVMACSTLFTLEVERIWLFALPFVAVPVAALLDGTVHRESLFRWTVGLLAAQTVTMEIFLNTRW